MGSPSQRAYWVLENSSTHFVFLFFKDWFGENANTSHLYKYYLMLTLLSSGNLCFYCYVSYWYMHGEGEAVRVHPSTTSDDGHQDSVTASHPSNGSPSTSLSRRRSKTFEIYGGIWSLNINVTVIFFLLLDVAVLATSLLSFLLINLSGKIIQIILLDQANHTNFNPQF